MNIPLLSYLVNLIEEVLKSTAPAVGKAAGTAAASTVESDPKAQAIIAASAVALAGIQGLKTAVNEHPDAPEIIPADTAK
jgi:hypothetical protein